MSSGLLGCDTM